MPKKPIYKVIPILLCLALFLTASVHPYSTVSASTLIDDESTLSSLTTDELIDKIVGRGYAVSVFLWDTPDEAYAYLLSKHTIFSELETRPDAAAKLFQCYQQMAELTDSISLIEIELLKVMLSQPVYGCQLQVDSSQTYNLPTRSTTYSYENPAETISIDGIPASLVATKYTLSNNPIYLYTAITDYSTEYKAYLDSIIASEYAGEVSFVASATTMYNCHSYAWYRRTTANTYWLNYVDCYMLDSHYITVSKSSAQVGDIVVYSNENGYSHSAIITNISTSSIFVPIIICESKWGPYGVYQHSIEKVHDAYSEDPNNPVYVIKRYINDHPFSYTSLNASNHKGTCPYCDVTKTTAHRFEYTNQTSNHIKSCTQCSYSVTQNHTYTYTKTPTKHTVTCSLCGYSFTGTHTYNSITGACKVCGYVSDVGSINTAPPDVSVSS